MIAYANRPRPGYSMSWSPAPLRRMPPSPTLGQATEFAESPLLALITDGIVAGSSAFLAWGLGTRGNKWSTFWWVVSGISFVKLLHDSSRM